MRLDRTNIYLAESKHVMFANSRCFKAGHCTYVSTAALTGPGGWCILFANCLLAHYFRIFDGMHIWCIYIGNRFFFLESA